VPLVSESETREGWGRERAYWKGVSDQILGTLTDRPPGKPVMEWLGAEMVVGNYTMQRVRYLLTAEEWGYAWVLVPVGGRGKKNAAVIALHQTVPAGKHEAVGLEVRPGGEYLPYGAELAARGFVVFAPDAIAFGERMGESGGAKYRGPGQFFAAHPEGSVIGKMAYDVSRAVDLLETLEFVDGERIGCIGHSHGAYGTLFAMVQDERIRAGVISCGVTLLRADPKAERWWRLTSLIPRLGYYEGRMEDTPIEFHQWMALVAPRPMMVVVGTRDAIFPNTAPVGGALDEVRKVYALHGVSNDLHAEIFDGPHSFPNEIRGRAYRMLDEALRR
jgi:dienelactone hydrolase